MVKRRFSSPSASNEIITCEYMALTFVKCITIMIAELVVTSGLRSSLEYMVWEWFWYGYGLVLA
jgi:hypothetical protein